MWMKRAFTLTILSFAGTGLIVFGEETKPVTPQTESTIQKPVESPQETKTTRNEYKRKSYSELYRESYNPKDYSKRYEEDYAENPIRTGSFDSHSRRLRRYRFDNDVEREPRQFSEGARPLNVPPAQPAPAEPAVVIDPAYSPLQPDRIFLRPVLRLPAPYVYRSLQKRAAERAAGMVDDATSEPAAPSAAPEPPQEPAVLQSPSDLLMQRAQAPFAARNYYEAARRFERLLNERPEDPQVRYAYGVALFASGQYSSAAGYIQPAKNAAKRTDVPLPEMGTYYSNKADFKHHQKRLNQYLQRNPDDVSAAALADLFE